MTDQTATISMVSRFSRRFRAVFVTTLAIAMMSVGAIAILLVATLTLFRARRLYSEYLVAPLARSILLIVGIRFVVHNRERMLRKQSVYIANHGSIIDIFIFAGLGIPNTRFFLSGHLRTQYPPLGVLGYLTGVFWTCPQSEPERRVELFQRADRILKKTGESVFLSPEGREGDKFKIASFNKGAFHLALSLDAPIVPMFISIPPEMNPGWSRNIKPGVVDVYVQEPVLTDQWSVDELDQICVDMHDYYLRMQQEYLGEKLNETA